MNIFFATNNEHKRQELQLLLKNYTIIIPCDKKIPFNPEETGKSFLENSLIKAKALWEIVHEPVLADDSGLCVDVLSGIPGIFSSRYRGEQNPQGTNTHNTNITQTQQNQLLIDHVNKVCAQTNNISRSCRYVCAMTLYIAQEQFITVQETFEGQIINNIEESRGIGGFGYDPIVFLPEQNKIVAELSEQQKNEISHRGKAVKKIRTFLDTL